MSSYGHMAGVGMHFRYRSLTSLKADVRCMCVLFGFGLRRQEVPITLYTRLWTLAAFVLPFHCLLLPSDECVPEVSLIYPLRVVPDIETS